MRKVTLPGVERIISVTEWTTPRPHILSLTAKITGLVGTEMMLVQYVKVWKDESFQKTEGRLMLEDVAAYEYTTQEQFDMLWNLA